MTDSFIDHPLAGVYFKYIDILKSRKQYSEAERLLRVAVEPMTEENIEIIATVIIAAQEIVNANDYNEFEELAAQLDNPS